MIDIGKLITKIRNAPQLVSTFGRGDPDPLDRYMAGMTGEERDWLIKMCEAALAIIADYDLSDRATR